MSFQRFLAVSTFALASAATSSAFAHAKLQSSDPRAGSTLDTAPKQVRLKFNETLEPAFSRIRLTGPGNKAIAVTAAIVDKADPTIMTAPLPLGTSSTQVRPGCRVIKVFACRALGISEVAAAM